MASVAGARRSVVIVGTRGYPSYYGGFETAVRHLAPFLAEHGWDVTVYGRSGSTKPEDPSRHPRVVSQPTWGLNTKSLSTLSYGLSAALHAVWRRPDVAIVMNVANGYWLPIFKLARIPTVVNVDGMEWERAKWGRLAKAVFKLGAWLTARFATELVADSYEIRDRWEAKFHRGASVIAYGGSPFEGSQVPPGLTHRGYVLWVARLVPENSVAPFLAAARKLSHDHDVVIVGSSGFADEYDAAVRGLAEASARVHALGHVSDDGLLFALWEHAGVYFHGHSVGGTNPALVQAMACGSPTLARDTVFNREVLGEGGAFCAPDPATIAGEISRLFAAPTELERLALYGRQRAASAYSWEDVCSAYASLARDLI